LLGLTKVSRDTSSSTLSQHSINRTASVNRPLEGLLDTTDKGRLNDEMVLGMLEFGYPFRPVSLASMHAFLYNMHYVTTFSSNSTIFLGWKEVFRIEEKGH
jgi:hypothetical protein